MTEGNAILVVGLLMVAVAVFLSGFHFRRPLVWMASATLWVVSAVVAYVQSLVEWDAMFFLFFIGVGLAITSLLLTFQSRRMDDQEMEEKDELPPLTPEGDEEVADYQKRAESVSKSTGGSVADRRRKRNR